MGTLSHVLHTGARPIGIHEFAEALRAICPPRFPAVRTNRHRPVALAVSGGVDSMALAYLCRNLRRYDINFSIADNPVADFRAFVVDHGLRPESATEAKAVCAALRAIGITPYSSMISWPRELGHDIHPKELPNFESVARRLRYQKLAQICVNASIVSLLFAHHQDDQYETVLMRLLQGHGARGLRGMRSASDIPECEGIHGAYRSGYVDDQNRRFPYHNTKITRRQSKALKHDMRSRIDYLMHEEELRDPVLDRLDGYSFEELYQTKRIVRLELANAEVEDGGIMVYRPLLEFPKDRLIATCEANNVPWWEDNTNRDPTLTMRNAIRHMCKNYTLPVALQKPSILALSRRCEQRAQALEAEADRLLSQTIIHDIEPNVGTASVQFPEYGLSRFPRDMSSPLRRHARIQRQREVAGLLIKKIIALVSPEEQAVPLANLQNVISRLFPLLSAERSAPLKAFGIAGVHFVPIEPSSSSRADGAALTWYLSRTPYPSHQPVPRFRAPYWHADQWHESRAWPAWWRWTLWDGRFWIRIRHKLPYRIIVQPFLLEHAKAFREALPAPRDRDRLSALLKHYAPGKTRFTLPALYIEEDLDLSNVVPRPLYPIPPCDLRQQHMEADDGGGEPKPKPKKWWNTDPNSEHPRVPDTSKMKLVALPSLDVHVPLLENWVQYEVRYRRIDRSTISTAGSFHRGSFLPSAAPVCRGVSGIARRRRGRLRLRR
ncbi:adenine nucleotide alpha hydrolases-like protein [Xylaria scruposa]|nr:adenine nucleotide alpha hydrolases-like protein [Xylaria scruposa]